MGLISKKETIVKKITYEFKPCCDEMKKSLNSYQNGNNLFFSTYYGKMYIKVYRFNYNDVRMNLENVEVSFCPFCGKSLEW